MSDEIIMVPRASLWQRFRNQLRFAGQVVGFLAHRHRVATAEEVELIRAHAAEVTDLRQQIEYQLLEIERRDDELRNLRDELDQAKSLNKLRAAEVTALSEIHKRLRTMVAADNAELALRIAAAEVAATMRRPTEGS